MSERERGRERMRGSYPRFHQGPPRRYSFIGCEVLWGVGFQAGCHLMEGIGENGLWWVRDGESVGTGGWKTGQALGGSAAWRIKAATIWAV